MIEIFLAFAGLVILLAASMGVIAMLLEGRHE